MQDLPRIAVTERNIVERDLALDTLQRFGIGSVRLHRGIHDRAEAFKAAHAVLELFNKVDQTVDRIGKDVDIQKKCREITGRDLAVDAEQTAANQHQELEQVKHKGRGAVELCHRLQRTGADRNICFCHAVKLLVFVVARNICLGHAHTRKAVFDRGIDDRVLGAHRLEFLTHLAAHMHGKRDHKRNADKDDQRQPEVDLCHQDKGADQQHDRKEEILGTVMCQLTDVQEVAHDTRDQRTGLVIVKKGKRELFNMIKQIAAHIRLHLGCHAVTIILNKVIHQLLEEIQHDQHRRHDQNQLNIFTRNKLVNDPTGKLWVDQIAERNAERTKHIECKSFQIRAIIRTKPFDCLHLFHPS